MTWRVALGWVAVSLFQVDPSGKRTIGVLTKPDLINPGGEAEVLEVLSNNRKPLKLGYVMVKVRLAGLLCRCRVSCQSALIQNSAVACSLSQRTKDRQALKRGCVAFFVKPSRAASWRRFVFALSPCLVSLFLSVLLSPLSLALFQIHRYHAVSFL